MDKDQNVVSRVHFSGAAASGTRGTPARGTAPTRANRRARSAWVALGAIALLAIAPFAFAQGKPDPKAPPKKGGAASAAASSAAPTASAPSSAAPTASASAEPAAEPAPSASASASASASGALGPGTVPGYGARETGSATDVAEDPLKRYMFIGARYRGSIVPKFAQNLFVDEGATVYTNTVGIEFDLRKDGFSFVPALSFQELGTGDILFHQKNQPTDIAGNYSVVNSSMKTIFASVDLLWSANIHKNIDFEFGGGFGFGVLFGDLQLNWVYEDQNGPYYAESSGKHYSQCPGPAGQETPNLKGCNKADHRGADTVRTGGFTEPSWFSGGSKPPLYLWATPQIGLRIKPVKQFQARLGLGFSLLTGPWFGLSGYYGLERTEKAAP